MKPTISLAQYLSICNNITCNDTLGEFTNGGPGPSLIKISPGASSGGTGAAATDLSVPLRQIEDSEERKQV